MRTDGGLGLFFCLVIKFCTKPNQDQCSASIMNWFEELQDGSGCAEEWTYLS